VGYDAVVVVVVASRLTQSCIQNVFVATASGGGSQVAGRAGSGCGGVGQVEELGLLSLGCTTTTAAAPAAAPPTPWPALADGRLGNANAHGAAVARLYDFANDIPLHDISGIDTTALTPCMQSGIDLGLTFVVCCNVVVMPRFCSSHINGEWRISFAGWWGGLGYRFEPPTCWGSVWASGQVVYS
jgi:hypothetical protein